MTDKTWSLVPALDCPLADAVQLARALGDHPFVSSWKVGFALGLRHGMPTVVRALREAGARHVVYDHQKAGTDIPDTGTLFADVMAEARVDEAILFPQAGPETLEAWVEALRQRGVGVVVGGAMTHRGYVAREGGFLLDDAGSRMFRAAAGCGVRSFVVPLTRPEEARAEIAAAGIHADATFWSPGYGAQGGDPSRFDFVRNHRLIVGRALLRAADPVAWVDDVRRKLEGRE